MTKYKVQFSSGKVRHFYKSFKNTFEPKFSNQILLHPLVLNTSMIQKALQ